jgi:high-affinity Fe2+/Pb2+ permease
VDPAQPPERDLLVGELHRDARDRRILSVAAAVGIIAGAVLGLVFIVLAISSATTTAFYRHRAPLFVLGAPVVSMLVGYVVYRLRRRHR